jgi:RHS repeat-associated protein
MTSKTLNGGANMAPEMDPTTNRLTSGYDANGNMLTGFGLTMTYDGRNRVASATPTYSGTEYYGYAPDNKRIYRWNPTAGTEKWTFYGAKGERIGTFALNTSGAYSFGETVENIWFGKKLVSRIVSYGGAGALMVVRDRLGTNRETGARYYPYGDEITSTANGLEKFGTYVRDSFTAMDYADQRYYTSAYGRFNTADPYGKSSRVTNPGSWNRYTYASDDPVNRNDPSGRIDCWSYYLDLVNNGYSDPDSGALGNCADAITSTGVSLDPCSVNPEVLNGLSIGESCDVAPPCYSAGNSSGCNLQVAGGGAGNQPGAGGGGGAIDFSGEISRAVDMALNALENPKCNELFGTLSGLDPSSTLLHLYQNDPHWGSIGFGPIPPPLR